MCKNYNNNLPALSELWEAALNDDHRAYSLLYTNLCSALHSYLLQIVKDDELANDLLQELFGKLWHRRKQIGIVYNVKAYFFTALRSIAINHFRKVKFQTSKLEHFIQPEIDFSAEDILVSAEENVQFKYKMGVALNTLPARQREIIHLKYYEGMEYNKIAELTGIRYQSVINHVFRGLETLRAEFRPYKTKEVA